MVRVEAVTEAEPRPDAHTDALLAPYLPRLVRAWSDERESPRVRELEGSLVSVDISGFTALAERLASKGRAGAEELVQRISSCFDGLIEVAERHGGDVLKFRGDALLLLFYGDRHAARAAGAASDMQWTIESLGSAESSVGPVELRMSAGVHSGTCHFFLAETPHRELLVAGPAATRVFELEDLASAGEIVLSTETAAEVDPSWLAEEKEGARLMRRLEPGASTIPPPPVSGTGARPRRVRARAAPGPPRRLQRRGRAPPGDGRLREGLRNRRADPERRRARAARPAGHAGRRRRPRLRDVRADLARVRHRRRCRQALRHRRGALELRAGRGRHCAGAAGDRRDGRRPADPRGRESRPRLHGRHRRRRPPDVRRDGGHRQSRGAARVACPAGRHPRHGRRARPGADDLRDREGAAPRQGQGARRDRAPRGCAGRLARRARGRHDADRGARTRARHLSHRDRRRAHAHARSPRAGGRARDRQVTPHPRAAHARARLHAADARRRAVRVLDAVLRVAERTASAGRDHAGPLAGGGRSPARAVGRGRHARPRAVAAAAGDPVRRGSAVDDRDRGPRSGREP